MTTPYAELHAHTNFSFLDGASAADDLVERAVARGLTGLAITDHNGLYGAVRFMGAAEEAGLHGVVGTEIDLLDAAVPDPDAIVIPPRRRRRRRKEAASDVVLPVEGRPVRPRPERAKLPGHRDPVKEDFRGIGARARGPHLVLLARSPVGWRSLSRLISRANLAGTKAVPRFRHELLEADHEGVVALSGCRDGEIARRLRVGDRAGARAAAERYATIFGRGDGASTSGFFIELSHHLLPDDDWLVAESADLAAELGLPVVVTNDVHYATADDREFHDVLTAIRHGRALDTLADLRRPDSESFIKSGDEMAAIAAGFDAQTARAWREGIATSGELAASCSLDLEFEQYRFPGFPVPDGETPFSYLSELCWAGAKRRYHPLTSAVVKRLAHELDVIERAGLAEFFLICWDLMRFAKEQGIPAQGRGSATSSIVSYTLGISRVEPITHDLLFERFINPGRTTYPDVDIDFSSERREEVIQYIYRRYGPEHTGMVCNLVTYRARSAVREVGYALGFPRPLVDRVAKALETYDSVMVRRDLEADGGFAEFFDAPTSADTAPVEIAAAQGLTDPMGQLDHARGGRIRTGGAGEAGNGRLPRKEDARRQAIEVVDEAAVGHELIDQMGRLDKRLHPLVGKVPPWKQPPKPEDPDAPQPFAWLREGGDEAFRADPPAPRTTIRGGGPSDDEGGPGDSPASVAWLRAGRGTGYVPVDPEHGQPLPSPRKTDRLGRPSPWDPPLTPANTNSVARIEPEPAPQARGGSTVGLSHWERWLEFCARIDGFPRHLSIHSGGMLVTAAPLIDIAPIEKATMVDRVVVQFDKRDVETLKLIKLDLLGLGMLAAMDETLQLIQHDCAVCLDLDKLPEEIAEVFAMLQAADTVGVFLVESRAQMQTLPKSKPQSLDDLVVEVAIIRPGPIQGNAVHPFLRRKQGLEPVTYLHPSLEPVLKDSMGVILYQEQVMRIAIEVAGFSPAESDGFRRAMGTWRSSREMEKLHARFVDGALQQPGMTEEVAEELFRQVAAFASFGFAKSHAAAFARTAYESAFLKLFYPAQFLVGLINAQPMGFYPVEVLVNDTKRHGVAVLPVDINASSYMTTTEWVGIEGQPAAVVSSGCIVPSAEARDRWTPPQSGGWGVRLGLHLVKGIGEQHEALLDAERARGPYRNLVDVVERTDLPEEVLERLIRSGAMDSLERPRRELLWQLREVAGASRGRMDGRTVRALGRAAGKRGAAAGRPMDLRLPATEVPPLPAITESERIGDAYAVLGVDAKRQVVGLFRGALDRLGAVTNASLSDRRPGRVRVGGLVVTRQHPMTAKGTVFLALEDETGMVNVTLWPTTWERLRSVVRRHALLLVDGELQREGSVVNLVAHDVRALPEVAATAGGPTLPGGVRQMGHAGMRRLG
ncbi:MAG TPA: PHP domain-containing protein [Candidatus Limnocylindrales bacterium]|nr:PHP domain-containing protein [Candidatus Limnocylindrales bacterium]